MKQTFIISAILCCMMLIGCSDDDGKSTSYDPSQPVVFTDFSPKEGQVRTRLYIYGKNFGTDETKIHVNVGGQEAKVIGSTGEIIYCMVQKRSYDGNVTVTIDGEDGKPAIEPYTFAEKFNYVAKTTVGTLLRVVDEYGNSGFTDGSFDDGASVPSNDWMVFDPKYAETGGDRLLFTCNFYDGLRVLNLTQRTVSRLFARSQYSCMYSFSFTADGDTLIFPDDNGNGSNETKPNLYYCLRSEGFKKLRPYNYGPCAYSVVCLPNGSKFYSSWTNATVYRMENPTGEIPNTDVNRTHCFALTALTQTDGQHMRLILHPTGKYMYITMEGAPVVLRSNYNEKTNMFETPIIIAGAFGQNGCQEGTGATARFDQVWAGVFVKNEDYVKNPRPDGEEYDFYFCAKANHCIWKLTPDGVATIIAGRSNQNADGKVEGYIDGDPLTEARFHTPAGIAYDETDETWYIGDNDNKGIRYITRE